MLASWMRMKFPHKVYGALAASAPILHFKGTVDPNDFTRVASSVIKDMGGQECYDLIHFGFFDIVNVQRDKSKYQAMKDHFNLCEIPKGPNEIQNLIDMLSESIGTISMINYPYATDFLGPLPAWPVNASCNSAKE